MKEFKLVPYAMTLFVKLNFVNKTFTCFVRIAPKV
jgi:hypothetical protein